MKKKSGSQNGLTLIELVLGLTLFVIIIGIGYRALLAINRQQTSAANKAARLNLANSTKNALIDFLGRDVTDPNFPEKNGQRFDHFNTTGIYWLSSDPADNTTGAGTGHLEIDNSAAISKNWAPDLTALETSQPLVAAAYKNSKYKIKVDIRAPEAPTFDRRVIVTVQNTDQGKKGSGIEEEEFEYFLVKPRRSASGGTITFRVLNGSPSKDPDGVLPGGTEAMPAPVGVGGISRIKAQVEIKIPDGNGGFVPTGEVRYARSGVDGVITMYGLPLDVKLTVKLIGNQREGLIPYYDRRSVLPAEMGQPSGIWNSILNREFQVTLTKKGVNPCDPVFLWPYARVKGTVENDDGTRINDIGIHFRPIHLEISGYETTQHIYSLAITKRVTVAGAPVDGTYQVDLVPGFYYRAVYGSVTKREDDLLANLSGSYIQAPDRRNLPNGKPNSDRNNDPDDSYPYGIVDSPGMTPTPPVLYGAPILPSEGFIQNLKVDFPNPQPGAAGPYPKCIILRPGQVYDDSNSPASPANNVFSTHLRLRPMDHVKFRMRVAQWDSVGKYFKDAGGGGSLVGSGLIVNAFTEFRKMYRDPKDLYSDFDGAKTEPGSQYSANTFLDERISYQELKVGGRTGGIVAGKISWDDAAPSLSAPEAGYWFSGGGYAQGDIPNLGLNFYDLDPHSSDETRQFKFDSSPIIFPHGWAGALTPILLAVNTKLPREQLYVFWHGEPVYNPADIYKWPNGREDGELFTINPNMEAFSNEHTGAAATDATLTGYTINKNHIGLNDTWGDSSSGVTDDYLGHTQHPYHWFRWAMLSGEGNTGSTYMIMPLTQMGNITGELVKADGTAWRLPDSVILPVGSPMPIAQISTWGVEYTAGDNPTAANSQGFVNFKYTVPLQPSNEGSCMGDRINGDCGYKTYDFKQRVIPTLRMVDKDNNLLSSQKLYGNGRVVEAKIAFNVAPLNSQLYARFNFYEKKKHPVTGEYYLEKVANFKPVTLEVRPGSGGAAVLSSPLRDPVGNVVDEFIAQTSSLLSAANQKIYFGKSDVYSVPAGDAIGPVADIKMSGAAKFELANYFARVASSDWVDWQSPASSILGTALNVGMDCVGGGTCGGYAPYHLAHGFLTYFYTVYAPFHLYKKLQPASVVVTVKDGSGSPVPNAVVRMFTSSLIEQKNPAATNPPWKERCTAVTNAAGMIDFMDLQSGNYGPVTGTNCDPTEASSNTDFDGFPTIPGAFDPPPHNIITEKGVSNIAIRIDANGKKPYETSQDAAGGDDVEFTCVLQDQDSSGGVSGEGM